VKTTRQLIQILLPVYDNEGKRFDPSLFATTREELTDRFGGLTAYMRAPARGVWKTDDGEETTDDIVIFEVMSDDLDAGWWRAFRGSLEARFRQELIIVRALTVSQI
jgi:hypothetical protein